MPTRAPRPCTHPGCRVLTQTGRCEAHPYEPIAKRVEQQPRGKTKARGYGGTWQRLRKMALARMPVCMICHRKPSTDVDHIIPLLQGGSSTMSNLQGLCHACHSSKTATQDGGLRRPPVIPAPTGEVLANITVVCGPPCAGKTVYCSQQQGRVIDLDEIIGDLTGIHGHDHPVKLTVLTPAMREKNRRIRAYAQEPGPLWITATAAPYGERRKWAETWGAHTVVIETPETVCMQRADSRPHPNETKDVIARWWRRYVSWYADEVISGMGSQG